MSAITKWWKNRCPLLANGLSRSQLLFAPVQPNVEHLRQLEKCARNAEFRDAWCQVKLQNKINLAMSIPGCAGVVVNPQTLFDIQGKPIRECERQ
ncbi:MAG: glycogen/starch/alpha-glucan phosphorylase [Desulfomonilaceae bacterium]